MTDDIRDLAPPEAAPFDWAALRNATADDGDPAQWRSLDELSGSPQFLEELRREFPRQIGEWNDPASRRKFLQLMSAS